VANVVGAEIARRIRILYGIWACCLLSAVGNLIIAAAGSFGVVAAGRFVAGMGVGLSILFIPAACRRRDRAPWLPDRPIGGLGLLQVGGNIFPILVVPLFGAALASGDADAAFLALAAFTLLTAALNARPAVPSEPAETT
jgi:Sugar (and other) transporter